MRTKEDLAWSAGLFEGEGCFTLSKSGNNQTPQAVVASTDLDVLEKFQEVVGFGSIREVDSKRKFTKPHHKTRYDWGARSFEMFQALVALLWPHLCSRRKQRATEILVDMRLYYAVRKDKRRGRTNKH